MNDSFCSRSGERDHTIVPDILFRHRVSGFLVNVLSFRIFSFAETAQDISSRVIDLLPRDVDVLVRLVVVDHVERIVDQGLVVELRHGWGEGLAVDVDGVVVVAGPVVQVRLHDGQPSPDDNGVNDDKRH